MKTNATMNTWMIKIAGVEHGPYTTSQLAAMGRGGEIDAKAMISKNGGKWYEAQTVRGLEVVAAIVEPVAAPEVTATPVPVAAQPTKWKLAAAVMVASVAVAAGVGYIAGREHLKHQMRNAMAQAFTGTFRDAAKRASDAQESHDAAMQQMRDVQEKIRASSEAAAKSLRGLPAQAR